MAVANLNSPSTSKKDAYKCYTSPGISGCQHGANLSKVIEKYRLQTYSKNKNTDLQKYQERSHNQRTRKYTSLRMLSCSCSSGWPFKYKRSNANKQTWTLIVFSDTPFLALVLRICIQIMSFQISSTLVITFIVFHLLPTLEACCMKLPCQNIYHHPRTEPGDQICCLAREPHIVQKIDVIMDEHLWSLEICLSVSFKIIDKIQQEPNLARHPRIQKLCRCASKNSPGMAKFCSFHDHKLPPHNPKQMMSHLVSWICTQP